MASDKIVLYGFLMSPPVRAVLLTLKALDLPYEFKHVNTQAGEHQTEEFLKKNPQHTVPVLVDNDGSIISESHAICAYLVRKYGKDEKASSLYPKGCMERALVDQRLYYEASVLFVISIKECIVPVARGELHEIAKEKIAQIHEAYTLLETFLAENRYFAGTALTIADFSLVSTVSSLHYTFAPVDVAQWPKLSTWLTRISQLPYYEEANGTAVKEMGEFIRSKLPKQFDKLWQKAVTDIKSAKQ